MSLPKDPVMLLSAVNMKLRDQYTSLKELAAAECVSEEEVREKLAAIGYFYNEEQNSFR